MYSCSKYVCAHFWNCYTEHARVEHGKDSGKNLFQEEQQEKFWWTTRLNNSLIIWLVHECLCLHLSHQVRSVEPSWRGTPDTCADDCIRWALLSTEIKIHLLYQFSYTAQEKWCKFRTEQVSVPLVGTWWLYILMWHFLLFLWFPV